MVTTSSRMLLSVAAAALALTALATSPAGAQGIGGFLKRMAEQATQQPATPAQNADAETPDGASPEASPQAGAGPVRSWLGYSLQVQAMRPLLLSGDFTGALAAYKTGKTPAGEGLPLPIQAGTGANSTLGQLRAAFAPAALGASSPSATVSPDANAGGVAPAATSAAVGFMQPLGTGHPFLVNTEVGTLLLDTGDITGARDAFNLAGQSVDTGAAKAEERRGIGGRLSAGLRSVGRLASAAAGNAELGPYNAPDLERVLQLNYLSLAYLMAGDDKAFNVTRRVTERQKDSFESLNDKAARLQDEARVAFEKERADAQSELSKIQDNPEQAKQSGSTADQLSSAYATPDDCKAPNLPSAYVNPLSFYLSGVVYEISSVQFREDFDSARIAYEKAFRLSPNSGTLRRAVADLNSNQVSPDRLVHVIVAEGFAPTRQAIRTQLSFGSTQVPLTIPRLTCHPSDVATVRVRTVNGRTLANLDPMANIEGLMLQRQKDREPLTALSVTANVLRSVAEQQVGAQNQILGMALQIKQESFDRPDMRSWSTLPARVHVARVRVPMSATEIELVSLNGAGQVVGTTRVALDTQSVQNVVYGRAVQSSISARASQSLWIRGMKGA